MLVSVPGAVRRGFKLRPCLDSLRSDLKSESAASDAASVPSHYRTSAPYFGPRGFEICAGASVYLLTRVV